MFRNPFLYKYTNKAIINICSVNGLQVFSIYICNYVNFRSFSKFTIVTTSTVMNKRTITWTNESSNKKSAVIVDCTTATDNEVDAINILCQLGFVNDILQSCHPSANADQDASNTNSKWMKSQANQLHSEAVSARRQFYCQSWIENVQVAITQYVPSSQNKVRNTAHNHLLCSMSMASPREDGRAGLRANCAVCRVRTRHFCIGCSAENLLPLCISSWSNRTSCFYIYHTFMRQYVRVAAWRKQVRYVDNTLDLMQDYCDFDADGSVVSVISPQTLKQGRIRNDSDVVNVHTDMKLEVPAPFTNHSVDKEAVEDKGHEEENLEADGYDKERIISCMINKLKKIDDKLKLLSLQTLVDILAAPTVCRLLVTRYACIADWICAVTVPKQKYSSERREVSRFTAHSHVLCSMSMASPRLGDHFAYRADCAVCRFKTGHFCVGCSAENLVPLCISSWSNRTSCFYIYHTFMRQYVRVAAWRKQVRFVDNTLDLMQDYCDFDDEGNVCIL